MELLHSSWLEIEDYLKFSNGIIIPTGSIEQHGPIGLIGTDTLCANDIATEAAKKILKLINKNGTINLGGPTQTAYKFAKKYNKNVKKGLMKNEKFKLLGKNTSINLTKLKKYNV